MSQNRFDGLQYSINGDSVIGFTSVKEMKTKGWMDASKVATYLMDDDGKTHRKHLGLINLFATTHNMSVPIMRDLFKDSAVLEVDPGQSVTYDLPVSRTEVTCHTTSDTSEEQDYPGIDGTVFAIELSQEFTKGDLLTYDPYYGEQILVSNDHEVEQVGENFRHYVYFNTKDKTKYFPKDKLKAGLKYMKLTNIIGEYDTDFSGINMVRNPSGIITNEFVLGDPRGVETMYTAKAASMKSPGLKNFSESMRNNIQEQLDAMGGQSKEMFYMAKLAPDGKSYLKDSFMIGTTLEYLALAELAMMECHSLLFAKAGTFRTATGSKSINEGVWHQLRRGKIIKYSRPGGITFDQIHEAASYIYKNSKIPVMQRTIKFKVGSMAWANIMQLFREESIQQLTGLPAGMLGNDAQIGKVFSGPLDNLSMNAVRITSVVVPGIGRIEVELDDSLDYQPFSDRFSAGFFGEGHAWTSYSMVIWDATNPEYSNVTNKVKGASLVEGGSQTSNIYYVKPSGAHVVYGYEQGRMANGSRTEEVQSSLRYMGRTFWATSHSAALVLDTTRFVIIELQR